jgi:hypothetical protein
VLGVKPGERLFEPTAARREGERVRGEGKICRKRRGY